MKWKKGWLGSNNCSLLDKVWAVPYGRKSKWADFEWAHQIWAHRAQLKVELDPLMGPSILLYWILGFWNESKPKPKPPVILDSCWISLHLHGQMHSTPIIFWHVSIKNVNSNTIVEIFKQICGVIRCILASIIFSPKP